MLCNNVIFDPLIKIITLSFLKLRDKPFMFQWIKCYFQPTEELIKISWSFLMNRDNLTSMDSKCYFLLHVHMCCIICFLIFFPPSLPILCFNGMLFSDPKLHAFLVNHLFFLSSFLLLTLMFQRKMLSSNLKVTYFPGKPFSSFLSCFNGKCFPQTSKLRTFLVSHSLLSFRASTENAFLK